MKVGIVYPQIELGGRAEAVRRIGLAVEELGFAHLTLYDHVVGAQHEGREPKLWGPYTEKDPFHDPFVAFGFLAGLTERIELVTGVLILPQRQTVLVAQQAADVDIFSNQRLRLGVGSGWNYVEYDALGQDFASRGARADEQIGFLRRLWDEPLLSFEGRFDRIERGNITPRPRRSIPIWVGGFTDPAYRRGAALGDGFIFAGDADRARPGWARVQELLAAEGRDPAAYGAEWVMTAERSVDAVTETLETWREDGGTHASVVSMNQGLDSVEAHLDFIGRVAESVGLAGG